MKAIILWLFPLILPLQDNGFRQAQLQYERVRKAYEAKYDTFLALLEKKHMAAGELEVFMRVYKEEGILELWGKEQEDPAFKLLKEFPVCASSGHEGPKRRQGDCQVPEGFYRLVHFNPWSSYHLSFSIDYPNRSDRILGDRRHPGGNICIHGSCVTIGCIPLTDEGISELYVAAVEARNNGQKDIFVSIFPCRLEDDAFRSLKARNDDNLDYCDLWNTMKKEYDYFREYHQRLPFIIDDEGHYLFK